MIQKTCFMLLVCGAITAVPGGAEQQFLDAPPIRIEGDVVELKVDAGVLVVRHQQRGTRTRRAFQINRDTAFPRGADGEALAGIGDLEVGDRVIVYFRVENGRAVAISLEKVPGRES